MASLDGIISSTHISPLDNNLDTGLSAGTLTPDVGTVELVERKILTDKQKEQMDLLGMDPNDTTQVDLYLKMSPAEIQTKMDAVLNNLPDISGGSNEPDRVPSGDNSDTHEPEEPQTHVHKFQVDTSSPEWENMSNRQRIKTFLTSGAKAQFSDEQWNSMTNAQRNAAVEDFTKKELQEHYPNFVNMSEEEQLEAGSEFLNLMNIADANDMDLKDLLALQKNSPEQFEELSSRYYENNTKVDLVKDTQARRMARARRQFEALASGVSEYAQNNSLELNDSNRVAVTFEYLDNKVNNGTQLRGVNKDTYQALGKIKDLNNGSLDEVKAGDKKITDLFDDTLTLERDNEGNVLWEHPDNIKAIISKVTEEFAKCKTDEERLELFQSFGIDSQIYILSAFSHTDGNRSVKSILRGIDGGSLYMGSVDGKSSTEDQTWYATDGLRGLHEHNKGNISENGIKVVAATVKEFEAEPAALANVTSYELDENLAKAITETIGEREDANKVFEISNPLIAESDKISDEMKQFYAQNTIEALKSPEDRQSQANSLGKYNLDSFNKGVQKGYENIANGSSSNSRTSQAVNNATNPITNNSNSQLSAPQVQQAYATFINNSQDGKPISHELAVRIFQRLETNEQRDFLTSLTPQQVSQIPITVCNSFPELINTFIDLGKGVDIIQQCNVNTGNRTIQLMAKSKGAAKKQFNEWAANHTDRLAKCTYDELVASGAIAVGHNRTFNVLKA